jgi:hypothetical protein
MRRGLWLIKLDIEIVFYGGTQHGRSMTGSASFGPDGSARTLRVTSALWP